MVGRCLGGYIGGDGQHAKYLGENVKYWTGDIRTLVGVMRKHPQATYTGLKKSLQ